MPETKTIPPISVEEDEEGMVVLTLPTGTFIPGESLAEGGVIRLFLDHKESDGLHTALNLYGAELTIAKFERYLGTLPRESVRRDLGRAGAKVLRRLVAAHKSKQSAEEIVEHLFEVAEPLLSKVGLGK